MKSILKHIGLVILILVALYRLTSYSQTITEHVEIQEDHGKPEKHSSFTLYPSEPKTFSNVSIIKFDVYTLTHVTLGVYKTDGNLIEMLVDTEVEPGEYNIIFKAPEWLEKGAYTYKMEAGGESESMDLNYKGK